MTQVKLPAAGSNSKAVKMMTVAVASLLLLVGIAGTVLWPQGTTATTSVPENTPQLRSKSVLVADTKTQDANEDSTAGVHRYEMILARLKDDGGVKSTGKVILETYDSWAPIGVGHFDKLVANQFYDACRFFRVVDSFVVQFGINGEPGVQKKWRDDVLKDDPVVETNAYGTLTYATSGANSRTTQLFINTNKAGNARLDGMGFAPFGRIVEGMEEYVELINNEYHEKPDQGEIQNQGNKYLDREFPRLSYIESIRLAGDTPE